MTTATRRLPRLRVGASAVGFTVGVPALLGKAAGWPLPRHLPTATTIGAALTGGWRPDDHVVISVLALIAWLVWAQIAASVTVEVIAVRQGRAVRKVPLASWCRPLAIRVAATLMAVTPFAPRTAGAAPAPVAVTRVVSAAQGTTAVASASMRFGGGIGALQSAPVVAEADEPAVAVHVVCPGETLWDLAEQRLGDPLRWRELFDRNRGRPQPHGGHLEDPGLIRPGWHLELPAHPFASPPPPAVVAPTDPQPVHTEASAAPAAAEATSTPVGPAASPAAPRAGATTPEAALTLPPPPAATVPRLEPNPPAEPSPSEPSAPTEPGSGRQMAAVAEIGLPALSAGVMIGYLGALRRGQERRRRRHHRFPAPTPAQSAVERRVRSIARPESARWVDLALRHLAVSLQAEGAPPPPAVLAVRAGTLGVEVLISPPWPVAPGRFLPIDDGHTWRLDPTVDLEKLAALTNGVPGYLPAVVTVGDTDTGALLIDLDEAGTLVVDGEPEAVSAVLSAMALEFITAPWAETCDVFLVGVAPRLADLERAQTLAPEEAVAVLTSAAGQPGTGGLADGARGDIPAAPTIAIVGPAALEPDDLAALLAGARPHSGLAVVAAANTGGRCRLLCGPDGKAVLYPLGLTVTAASGAHAAAEFAGLLADTTTPDTDTPETSQDPSDDDPVGIAANADSTGGTPGDQADQAVADSEPPETLIDVLVLGPVEITWPKDNPKPQLGEFVAYLAAHPKGVTSDQARLDMWPATTNDDRFGERAPATFWSLTSKARRALGTDPAGSALLLREPGNTLRLSPAVGCDWTTFQHLTRRAKTDPTNAVPFLRDALSLVRGRPFQGSGWGWVEIERLDSAIEAAVTDAACDLADLALQDHDHDTARFAVHQGLLAVPHAEALLRSAMRVAAAVGDRASLERAWRDARRLATEIDSTAQPEPETVALYHSLRHTDTGS